MTSASDKHLVVHGVVREYVAAGELRRVLDGVDMKLSSGQSAAIIGPSGAGKSTLLNIIGSLDRPDGGTVRWGEVDVTSLTGSALSAYRARQVGFVFQEHHLLPHLSARQNVLLPTLAVPGRGHATGEAPADADALLESVGILHRADALPGQLSGGERQRVAIARALVNNAGLLLCDEPTGNLDRETGERIIDLFLELVRVRHLALIMVTHNEAFARRMDACHRLERGQLIAG